jgi:hypothetical protein
MKIIIYKAEEGMIFSQEYLTLAFCENTVTLKDGGIMKIEEQTRNLFFI